MLWVALSALVLLTISFSQPVSAQPSFTAGPCTGYQPAVSAGAQARVRPGGSNRVRQAPGLEAQQLGEMPSGTVFTILFGPVCANDYTWWFIRYGSLTGWTAEGQNTTHWLQPAAAENHAPRQPPDALGATSTSSLFAAGLCQTALSLQALDAFANGTEGGLSGTITFVLGADSLLVEPGICAPAELAGSISVQTPFGIDLDADVEVFGGLGYLRTTLPDIAYTIPGLWTLTVRDFRLTIDIQAPTGPFMQGLHEGSGGEPGVHRLILGGFAPHERIVIVLSHSIPNAVAYAPASNEVTQSVDPTTGLEVATIPLNVYSAVQEMVYINPATTFNPQIAISPSFAAALDGTLTELDDYTTGEVGELLFDQRGVDISVFEGIDGSTDAGSSSMFFGLTFQDFTGVEVTADASGFSLGTYALDGGPIAAIGQTGSMAIWTKFSDLYVPGSPGDPDTLRQTLLDAYWSEETEEAAAAVPCVYTVDSGDTLNRIARSYDITLEQLLAANPHVENPDVIRRGLVLSIPNCTP